MNDTESDTTIQTSIDTDSDPGASSEVGEMDDGSPPKGNERPSSIARRRLLVGLAGLGLLGAASEPASAQSTTLEFGGNYTGDPGSNYGLRLDPSNARFGLLGFSAASDGRGVVGRATSSSGTTIGVIGRSDSSSDGAAGLMGFNDASSGRTYGFKGRSDSTGGRGALGIATADSGDTIGLEGRADSPNGVAVSGTNTASSGTTYGVQGQVNSPDGYGLYTPDDARVEGNMATTGDWTVTVGGSRVLRLGGQALTAGNVVHGHSANGVFDGAQAATIGGGGYNDGFSTFNENEVYDSFGTVSGGEANVAGTADGDATSHTHATVGGGENNAAAGNWSTVGGGTNNAASGGVSTVGGGTTNTASFNWSTVGGGNTNTANGTYATVSGGHRNTASAERATVGGGWHNEAEAKFATIAGGGSADTGDPDATNNVVYDNYGTIAGGGGNRIGIDDDDPTYARFATVGGGKNNTVTNYYATVGGGDNNYVPGDWATVGGGSDNVASGLSATVGGGANNVASGGVSTVPGGSSGEAADGNTFLWNDGSVYHDINDDGIQEGFSSAKDVAGSGVTGERTFHASAHGGFRFVTGYSNVTYISGGSTGWSTTSTRAAKTNVEPVDPRAMLASVKDMAVSTWEYKDGDGNGQGVRHVGPMAEDFHDAFDVGATDTGINSINADGVLFAAVQGLAAKLDDAEEALDEKDDRIDALEDRVENRDDRIDALEDRVENRDDRIDALEAENEKLREELTAIDERVAGLEAEQSGEASRGD